MNAQSIFADQHADLFARYAVEIEISQRLAAARPSEPSSIAEMIARQMMRSIGVSRDEIDRVEWRRRIRTFLAETESVEDPEGMTDEDLDELAQQKTTGGVNSFLRDAEGIYFPGHSLKAAIKEAVNILYPYSEVKFGATRKGGASFVAERVFVRPSRIPLQRGGVTLQQADGIETLSGRVQGPRGPRAIVTQHEYVEQATLAFTLEVLANGKAEKELAGKWPAIFGYMEENGLGAHRKLTDYARFVTTRFDEL